jgi:hypothetical protein
MSQPTFFSSRGVRIAALLILFVAALAIRLYDLTDPPLDFHPTRYPSTLPFFPRRIICFFRMPSSPAGASSRIH